MEKPMKTAAIYARVSSDKQKEENTVASQTAALVEFARKEGYDVPREWIFEDEGFSGASLVRPGLERVRDLAAEGQLHAVLVYAPDRLSRKYAYQILLIEEFARNGVETVFVKAPRSATPEDQLLLQFQGMIAEYERAQILERSRRGKRHRARQGQVSVLSGAPFGYRYVRKSDETAAYYEVIQTEADVVRLVYRHYTGDHLSIGAITRLLNKQGVPTRKRNTRWERSTVGGMLRNPAYKGTACFGKTEVRPRQRVTRPLRMRGGVAKRNSANHERPRQEWIEIPVPSIVSEETFSLAQELLTANKTHAPRRTIQSSIRQGMVSCRKCGYALYRTSARTSARKIYYYRCLGSDRWRHLNGAVCDNPPIREELLDHAVWNEIVRLVENPRLIEEELDRRLEAAQKASPPKRRQESLQRDLARVRKSIERLMTAYQEDLLPLDELRGRMPDLRQRERAMRPNCSRSQPKRKIALRICAWRRRFRRFYPACAPQPKRSTLPNDNGSSAYLLRRYWSEKTRSSFAIQYRSCRRHVTTCHQNLANLASQKTIVIFCVQGAISPLLANPQTGTPAGCVR